MKWIINIKECCGKIVTLAMSSCEESFQIFSASIFVGPLKTKVTIYTSDLPLIQLST